MLGLGQIGWWSRLRVTQFQGHLSESRRVTHNTLAPQCGSVPWVDLHGYTYSYRGTCTLVEGRYYHLKEEIFQHFLYHYKLMKHI